MTFLNDRKVHLPLADGQIRLLKLKPASSLSDPIECSLFAISLTKSTRYEAVSYVWGDQNRYKVIKVNNVDFQIPGNLFEFLPYLRQHGSDRVLWIDGLCIDQTNNVEKSCQVNMMGDIYKCASHVIIFLGREWDGLDIVIKYLKLAAQQQEAHIDPALEPHLHVDGQSISTPKVARSLTRFFSTDWFFRVWTVQEFVLAKSFSFQCGSTELAGDLLLEGFGALRRHVQNTCCGLLSRNKAHGITENLQFFRSRTKDFVKSSVVRPGLDSTNGRSPYPCFMRGPPDDTLALQCYQRKSN
ncbi:heterokaryon incompatibility protein [Colletotrichum kahawae]|uniref:Heterokaryon incompatibility protein n=1 Tax=Colletotrichum kahawae TaxID=34407 RepID=A0AAD9Y542_COLKA|nr:heterokaryon incompatibility protein [Colletotrichum kahawae]